MLTNVHCHGGCQLVACPPVLSVPTLDLGREQLLFLCSVHRLWHLLHHIAWKPTTLNARCQTLRRFLLEWLSFLHRYVPVGLLEVLPQRLNWRPPAFVGRSDLETWLGSDNPMDWCAFYASSYWNIISCGKALCMYCQGLVQISNLVWLRVRLLICNVTLLGIAWHCRSWRPEAAHCGISGSRRGGACRMVQCRLQMQPCQRLQWQSSDMQTPGCPGCGCRRCCWGRRPRALPLHPSTSQPHTPPARAPWHLRARTTANVDT